MNKIPSVNEYIRSIENKREKYEAKEPNKGLSRLIKNCREKLSHNFEDDSLNTYLFLSKLIDGKMLSVISSQHLFNELQDVMIMAQKQNTKRFANDRLPRSDSLKIAIFGYPTIKNGWDPDTPSLPGSEECVVYGAKTLALMGHLVHVFIDPPKLSKYKLSFSNPRYFNHDQITAISGSYDYIFLWRNMTVSLHNIFPKSKLLFWPHDSPHGRYEVSDKLSGILYLSNHQKKQYEAINNRFENVPSIIAGNGFLLEQFKPSLKYKNEFSMGYFSNYHRGLKQLLLLWPEIKKNYPKCTLNVFYGRETWGILSDEKLAEIVSLIKQYENMGVKEKGKVDHITLANEMSETSMLVYPCNCRTETFCITAVKCQAAGMLCVSSRNGALAETVSPHSSCSSLEIYDNSSLESIELQEYKKVLFEKLDEIKNSANDKNLQNKIINERIMNIEFSKKHTWDEVCKRWIDFISLLK